MTEIGQYTLAGDTLCIHPCTLDGRFHAADGPASVYRPFSAAMVSNVAMPGQVDAAPDRLLHAGLNGEMRN